MKKGLKIFVAVFLLTLTIGGLALTTTTLNAKNNKEVTAAYVEDGAIPAAVLKQGSRGEVVKTVQQKLKRWGYYNGAVDGIYGKQTRAAVIYFQKRNGLVADGIVGKKTLAALGISSSSLGSQSGTGGGGKYSSADINLLARLIYGEARGESYTGQVAVAAVVLNRVESASFPNTISAVIYQPYAFSVVNDGQINLTPNQTAINAAKDAINGWDPTGGSLYYYNPAKATSSWIYTREVTVTIGNHVFAI